MLVEPKVFACGWEAVALWPWLCDLGEEFDEGWLDPAWLSRSLGMPPEIITKGVQSLLGAELVVCSAGVCVVPRVYAIQQGPFRGRRSWARPIPPVTDAHNAGTDAPAHDAPTHDADVPGHAHNARPGAPPREGDLLNYLTETWENGKLGKLDEWIEKVCEAYPDMDLVGEARSARAWETANDKRTKKNIKRFLDNWFRRAWANRRQQNIDVGTGHWSNLSRNERRRLINEGRVEWEHQHPCGVGLTRNLKDDLYILSSQDLMDERLPYRDALVEFLRGRLKANEDVHDPDKVVLLLRDMGARAETTRVLSWVMDTLSVDARQLEGLLPG